MAFRAQFAPLPLQLTWLNSPALFAMRMQDGTIHTCNTRRLESLPAHPPEATVPPMTSISQYGTENLAVGTQEGEIWIEDPCGETCLQILQFPSMDKESLAESDHRPPLQDLFTNIYPQPSHHTPAISALASHTISHLFAASQNCLARFSPSSHQSELVGKAKGVIQEIHPQTEESVFLLTQQTAELWLKEATSWKKQAQTKLKGDPNATFTSATLTTGSSLALATSNGEIHVCNLAEKTALPPEKAHSGAINKLKALKPHIFASCSNDRTIKIWDARTSHSVSTLIQPAPVTDFLSIEDQLIAATTHHTHPLKVIDLRTNATLPH